MLKLLAIILLVVCLAIAYLEDLFAEEASQPKVEMPTEVVSVVERHFGTPEVPQSVFPKEENRAEVVMKESPRSIRIIQLDQLGHEQPHKQQYVIKEGNIYFADFAGRPDYSKPAGKLKK